MSIHPFARRLGFLIGCLLAAAPADAQVDPGRKRVGEIQTHSLSTAHPYRGGIEHVYEIQHPGATYIKVHFQRFELASGDRLIVSNPEGTESYVFTDQGYKNKGENFWITSIIGDTAVLRLESNNFKGGFGFDMDYYAYGIVDLFPDLNTPQSVCGSNDWRDVECYQASHPTEYDRAKRAVVILFNGFENCTGMKVGCPNQIMTNEHCVTSQAEVDLTEVRFEFQRSDCANGATSFSAGYLGDQFQQDDFTLDYSVFTALGASDDYVAVEFDPRLPAVGERIYLSGHPAGSPKQLTINDDTSPTGLCRVDFSPTDGRGVDTDIGYFCDSTGGSSGSPVWSGESHKVIGLHHFGGCQNGAVRIDLIHPLIEPLLMSCCATPPEIPTIGVVTNGDNQIDVSWDDADLPGATEYDVKRSRTSGGPFRTLATIPDSSPGVGDGAPYLFSDFDVSGGSEYFYVVESTDGAHCTSIPSAESSATATGICTLGPSFAGVQMVSAPASSICTLDVSWNPATAECGGPVVYNVYRATQSGFTPSPANRIIAGVGGTLYQDMDLLTAGTNYFYKVRAVDLTNGIQDDNNAQGLSFPLAGCTTASSCDDNPVVNILPDGPLTVCLNSEPTLTANLSGGVGPFSFQWTRDGQPVPGATSDTYTPNEPGTSAYNVLVRADSCPDSAFDGMDTEVTQVNQPFFAGIGSVVNAQGATCTLDLGWTPAVSVCPGPVEYTVYRNTSVPVDPVPENFLAGGLSGTSYSDTEGLVNEAVYFYNVQARDVTTGQFDGNTMAAAGSANGPNSGVSDPYLEEFTDTMVISDWTITTGPGAHSCGEWAIRSDPLSAPVLSTGNYLIADNRCSLVFPRTSTTATSPPTDLAIAGLQSAMLSVNMRFDYSSTNSVETGAIEIWDGAQWIAVWNSAMVDVNQQFSVDVTSQALNNPNFMVRFDYQNANVDNFFSIDRVTLTTDVLATCATAPDGPLPIGAGSLSVGRPTGDATTLDLVWDAAACPTTDYNLLYGDLADVASHALLGSDCAVGTSGSHPWTAVPSGDLYFLLVGTDGVGSESSWGLETGFVERNDAAASNQCGASAKDVTGTCPN
jgi:hypothetical protein